MEKSAVPNSSSSTSSSSPNNIVINNAEEKQRMEQEAQQLSINQSYSLSNILAHRQSTSFSDLTNSANHIITTPCFRTSFLWASGISILLALHRYRQPMSTLLRVTNVGILGFFSTFGIQWYLCRRDEHDRKLALRAFYQNQQRIRASLRPLPTGNPDQDDDDFLMDTISSSSSSTSSLTNSSNVIQSNDDHTSSNTATINNNLTTNMNKGIEDEEWMKEIDRITSYNLPKVEKGPLQSVTLR